MKHLLLLVVLIASPALFGETIRDRVHSIEGGIIKFENGRVAFLDGVKVDLENGDYIRAEVNERSSLKSIEKLALPQIRFEQMDLQPETTPPSFEPTVVPNMEEAWNIFNRSNPNYKRVSECSDRAHVWALDEFKHSGTKSMKAFVFFTASYINSVRFKWWFHVAPMYKVNVGGTVQDLVMDFRYTDRPMTVKEWTDHYVYTKRACKVTTKFSEYNVNPQTENCYLIFESMHYRLPAEIHDQELSGRYKSETPESEYKMALRFAFEN